MLKRQGLILLTLSSFNAMFLLNCNSDSTASRATNSTAPTTIPATVVNNSSANDSSANDNDNSNSYIQPTVEYTVPPTESPTPSAAAKCRDDGKIYEDGVCKSLAQVKCELLPDTKVWNSSLASCDVKTSSTTQAQTPTSTPASTSTSTPVVTIIPSSTPGPVVVTDWKDIGPIITLKDNKCLAYGVLHGKHTVWTDTCNGNESQNVQFNESTGQLRFKSLPNLCFATHLGGASWTVLNSCLINTDTNYYLKYQLNSSEQKIKHMDQNGNYTYCLGIRYDSGSMYFLFKGEYKCNDYTGDEFKWKWTSK